MPRVFYVTILHFTNSNRFLICLSSLGRCYYIRVDGKYYRFNSSTDVEIYLFRASEVQFHLLMKGAMIYILPLTDPSVFSLQGYFLLFESMLDTVLFARDKWLKPAGCGKIFLELERVFNA